MNQREEARRLRAAAMVDSFGPGQAIGPPPGVDLAAATPAAARDAGVSRSRHAVEIEIGRIRPDPDQPREEFDPQALARLAASLKARGQLQPIRVRWDEGQGAYIIVVGERRYRAATMAGLATLSCVVHQGAVDPGERLALQLVENALREDLRPVEQAKAYRKLMEIHGWSGRQLAEELAIPQPAVVQALSLLKLPEAVQAEVDAGRLAPRTAYEVSKLEDAEEQARLAERVVAEKLTRDQAVAEVRSRKAGRPAAPRPSRTEFRLEGGVTVAVTGAVGPEAVRAALLGALDQLDGGHRAGGDQAAA
jgi:ParB family chromosome partitioning protein